MKWGIALAAAAVCAGLVAGDVRGQRTETRTERLAYGSKIWVKNRNGAISVTGWDREEVQLTAVIRDSSKRKVDLVVQRVGPDLDIEARFQQPMVLFSFGLAPAPRCELSLSVPRRILGHYRTTNGKVSVASLDGYVRCETTNGDIKLEQIKGEVLAETCNGSLDANNLRARIKGGTTNGHITLEDVDGGVELETTNGGIYARNLDGWGEGIRLESTNGSIEVVLGRATGELRAENSNGSLDIRVSNGQVLESSKHSARVKIPGRDQKIQVETTNGAILVH